MTTELPPKGQEAWSRAPVYVGVGSNLGDREAHLARAAGRLAALRGVEIERCSWVFDSAPVGPPQPRYLNAALELRTTLSPLELLAALKELERAQGRDRASPRWGPRPLDLDILLWGEHVVAEPTLQVPHLYLHQRAFALEPLHQLCPEARHPVLAATIRELLASVEAQDVRRIGPYPGGW